jgi:hypothetical protein
VQTEEIRILERDELISAVVQKHENMIAEYTTEYDALNSTTLALDTEIEELKKRIAENEEKTGIYDEKKHHYGYEASEELDKLNLKPADAEKIKAGIDALTSAKTSDSADERKEIYDALKTDISNTDGGDKSALLEKIDAAYQAYQEEYALKEALTADKELLQTRQGAVVENKRAEWLSRRIDSHKESLEYWKGRK